MATEYENELVSQYGSGMQNFIEAERAKGKAGLLGGVNVDAQDVSRITNAFRSLNPNQVFSTSNIVQASTNPVPRPDDLLGIRNQINTELGLPGLQKQYQDIYTGLQSFDQGTTGQQIALEAQPVALNVIRGEQAEAGRQRAFTREGMARQAQVAQSALAAAQQEASQRFAIREQEVRLKQQLILENPGAGITFGDSVESAARKIKRYQDALAKEERKRAEDAAKDAEKTQLKNLAMELGISTKGSRKELRKRISKEYKSEKAFERALKARSGSGSGDKAYAAKEKELYGTIDKLRDKLERDKINWSTAWNTINTRYQGFTPQEIDNLIGLDYRIKSEGR